MDLFKTQNMAKEALKDPTALGSVPIFGSDAVPVR